MATKKPPLRHLLDTIITIKLEPAGEIFHIHKGLLCHASPVFRAMMQHNWKEKQDGCIVLKDEDPEVFRRFIYWLYNGTVLDFDETIQPISSRELALCYFLADRRDIPALQNHLIDLILDTPCTLSYFLSEVQPLIWANTPEQSPLRKLLVDMMAFAADIPRIFEEENEMDCFDKCFVVDVLIRTHRTPKFTGWKNFHERRCDYHVHNANLPACSINRRQQPVKQSREINQHFPGESQKP
ncbi:MAG: hypothetical protein LQ339_004026 [Xanthoria mediterranea]|nr:MAG: hypothetical protein LQ339_004026 [Xanthoria mediterranea]